ALLEAAAEDVAVVNLLACPRELHSSEQGPYHAIPNILAFSGQGPALEWPGHLVIVNTRNYHQGLGSLVLLNCHRIVYPLLSGWDSSAGDWTLADWCDQCHRKGGMVIGEDLFAYPDRHPYGEVLADVISGRIDALQMDGIENAEADRRLKQAP